MKYGLSVNANETIKEIVEKSVKIEKLGFDYIWVADVPSQRYSPTVASVIAEKTSNIRIGLGLLSPFLHTPHQIANSLSTLIEFYGDRFELCIGPGDLGQLKRVGIEISKLKDIPELLLKAKEKIAETLCRKGLKVPLWIGAQGLRILKLAKSFNGVLLNYARPSFVDWAIKKMDLPSKHSIQIGVYAPSYVYIDREKELYQLLRLSSAIVALGASKSVLKKFGLYDEIVAAKEELERGLTPENILNEFPDEVVEKFAICMHSDSLRHYLLKLKGAGVEHVVFGYPQNFSEETIKALAKSLFE